MSEEQREVAYWRLLCVLLLLCPLATVQVARHATRFGFSPVLLAFTLVTALPGAFLLELLLQRVAGRSLEGRFWIVDPSVQLSTPSPLDLERAAEQVTGRLVSRGFKFARPTRAELSFHKGKSRAVHGFLDHAFSGTVSFASDGLGRRLDVKIQMHETLLLETGEKANLEQLAAFLGLGADLSRPRGVSLVTYSGLIPLLGLIPMAAATSVAPQALIPWVTSGSVGVLGMLAFALVATWRDRESLFGMRLILLGLFLASAPLLGQVLRIFGASP